MVTINDVRNALIVNGNDLADYLTDPNLEAAVFWDELSMDSLDLEELKSEIAHQKGVQIPEDVSVNDTVREFIDRINSVNY